MRGAVHSGISIAALFIALVGTPTARADVVNLTPVKDGTLFQNNVNASSGAGPALFAGTKDALRRHTVLEFDIASAVPAGAAPITVTLTLFIEEAAPGASDLDDFGLYRLLQEWGEAGSDSGNDPNGTFAQPGDATWQDAIVPGNAWSNPGGSYEYQGVYRTLPLTGPVQISDHQMTVDVHDWLVDPSSNHGWLLRPLPNDLLRRFGSREGANPPVLTIEFARAVDGAGVVPDGASVPGEPLRLDRAPGGVIDFVWGQGCRFDADFSLYSGTTGQFYDHEAIACTSSGETRIDDIPIDTTEGRYFLVVPVSAAGNEGAHGFDGDGNPRPRGAGPSCPRPQAVADPVCP